MTISPVSTHGGLAPEKLRLPAQTATTLPPQARLSQPLSADRFQKTGALRFGSASKVDAQEQLKHQDMMAHMAAQRLPVGFRLALAEGLKKATELHAPQVGPLFLLYGWMKLAQEHLDTELGAAPESQFAEESEARRKCYQLLNLPQFKGLSLKAQRKQLDGLLQSISTRLENQKGGGQQAQPPLAPQLASIFIQLAQYPPNEELANDNLIHALFGTHSNIQGGEFTQTAGLMNQFISELDQAMRSDAEFDLGTFDLPALKNLMGMKSPLAFNTLNLAEGVARRANSAAIEPKHLALALVRQADLLLSVNPEFATYAPDLLPDMMQIQDGRKIPAYSYRIALDTLIPVEKRTNLGPDQLTTLLGDLRRSLETLVFGDAPVSKDWSGDPKPSKSLADLLQSALEAPQGEYPLVLGERMRENLSRFRQPDDQRLGNLLQEMVGARLEAAIEATPPAKTPKEFAKLLEKKFAESGGAMSRKQYQGFKQLITQYEAIPPNSPDADKFRQALDLGLNQMAWKYKKVTLDPAAVQARLDAKHTGLEEPKKNVVRMIATLKRQLERGLTGKGRVIGLVGPPGVGKTSIAQAVAEATGRDLVKISVGGSRDESDIKGHTRTYVGARPGLPLAAFAKGGSMNPVIVLDEVDKLYEGNQGSPSAALLEFLDPEQNHGFVDKFLAEVPIDLSQSLIIATANELERISGPLRDRIDFIELEAYDEDEKVEIAKNHLIPNVREEKGLDIEEFNPSGRLVRSVIRHISPEGGVRKLKAALGRMGDFAITGESVKEAVETMSPEPVDHTEELERVLGPSKAMSKFKMRDPQVGLGTGLAVLGGIMGVVGRFEAGVAEFELENPNSPAQLTLGAGTPAKNMLEMTHDSFNRAYNWVRQNPARLKELGFDYAKHRGKRLELSLATETGGKMDGDSAGAVMTLTLVSALTGRKIRNDVAMTGTITYKNHTLAIGGLKQKLQAAREAGMSVTFFPEQNLKDFKALPEKQRQELVLMTMDEFKAASKAGTLPKDKMTVVPADDINDILDYALLPKEAAKAKRPSRAKQAAAPAFSGSLAPQQPAAIRRPLSLIG